MFNLATLEAKLGAVAIAIVLLSLYSIGIYEYGKHAQAETDKNLGLAQQVVKGKIEGAQNDTTMQVANSYSDYIAQLQSKLDWMRKHPTIVKAPVSRTPSSPEIPDAAIPEFGRTCTRTFYENALDDVIKLNAWQRWAVDQHIPVK